ncbi:MarR family transcriptional regulator [Thermobrachium celere]|uniref:Transcriptional regulator of fatty acid biosynthesis FabT n=2 Tax=Thermobrachium TaxID=150333 RepID=R7RRK1_9CLOT|nr:MarR family transcriptional regulator [Thermobrachium celere]GFR34836.1 MarR family transcriptional regulator [Thermobrachium celere]CDF58832.1 Transcriptional regulator of fatty acid biosynthesis FabT [Thermobrachium celere DSM 8682]
MSKTYTVLNELLVELFNDILMIEQQALRSKDFNDLSITEIHTIEAIGMYGDKTMSEVAEKLNITVGTLTVAVNNLEKKGYVERRRSEEDRRIVYVHLTNKGKLAYRMHEKFHSAMINEVVEGLTDEEEKILISSLEKLNNFFKQRLKKIGGDV